MGIVRAPQCFTPESPAPPWSLVGIVGFFYNASFTSDESVRDAVFGVFDVNGWHNVVHILTGVLGLLAFSAGAHAARTYAMAVGVVYLAVAAVGLHGRERRLDPEHRPGQHRGQHPPPAARRGGGGSSARDACGGSCERPARGRLTRAAVPLGKPGQAGLPCV